MQTHELVKGCIYKTDYGFAEFAYVSGVGWAVFHPPGDPGMQSSYSINPNAVQRIATEEEAKQCIAEAERNDEEDE